MKRKTIYIVKIIFLQMPFLLVSYMLQAQNGPVTAGGIGQDVTGSVSFSLGQVFDDFAFDWDNKHSVAEGLQQPYEFSNLDDDGFSAILFPNPTSDYIYLQLDDNYQMPENGLVGLLYNNLGKLLQQISITEYKTQINMWPYSSSVYYLSIYDGGDKVGTYKIVKIKMIMKKQ